MSVVTIDRRAALIGAASALAMPGLVRAGTPITLKYATNLPASHVTNVRLTEAFGRIAKATGGQVEIQIFPDGQLGSDTDMLSQLRSGALDFFQLSSVILSTLVPAAALNGVGFVFPSYDDVWRAMDGELGAYQRAQIQRSGLVAMERIWDTGYRQVTSSTRVIRTPKDMVSFKLRVPPGPLWVSMFKALETLPTTINFNETYSALQTKIVEGTELPLSTISVSKIYEVQKSVSLTRHMWDGLWALANKRVWDGLPEEVRSVIAAELDRSSQDQRDDVRKLEATVLSDLAGKGLQVVEVDGQAFRAKLQAAGFYKEWRGKLGPEAWALLEKYTGPIT